MAPKKKPKKPKAKSPAPDGAVGVDLSANVEKLEAQVKELTDQLKKQEGERNYFQLERDKFCGFFEVSKSQLDETRATLRTKDREIEELVENHQVTIKVYQQKIKDILYGHQQDATQLKMENESSLKSEEDFHRIREEELQKEKQALKLQIREQAAAHREAISTQKEQNARALSLLREQYEGRLRETQRAYEARLREAVEDAELRRKAEVREVEARKNSQIDELIKKHEQNFARIKSYYSSITHSNLELIKSLKDELEDLRKRQAANEKLMFEIAQDNRRLTRPLQEAVGEVASLKRQLQDVTRENQSLHRAHDRARALERELKAAVWEADLARQRVTDLEGERDDLRTRFETAVEEVAERSVFREELLERRLKSLSGELETRDAQLSEILTAANVDGPTVGAITSKLDTILDGKNKNIRELSFELSRVMRLYNESLRVFREKMSEYGVPDEVMGGFRPFAIVHDGNE